MRRPPRIPSPKSRFPPLYAVLDVETAERHGWQPVDLARAYLDAGARFLQVRAKQLPGGALLDLAAAVATLARAHGATLIVNDRADIATLAGADGVHVGQDDLAPDAVRILGGEALLVGKSTHTVAQLEVVRQEPVDYVAVGPVFGSATKATGYDAVGLEMVARAASMGRPVVAIGGITLENAPSVIEAGASSVAVISDLLATGDPKARVQAFLSGLGRHPHV